LEVAKKKLIYPRILKKLEKNSSGLEIEKSVESFTLEMSEAEENLRQSGFVCKTRD